MSQLDLVLYLLSLGVCAFYHYLVVFLFEGDGAEVPDDSCGLVGSMKGLRQSAVVVQGEGSDTYSRVPDISFV